MWEADLVPPFATLFNQSFRSSLHSVAMFFTTLAPFGGARLNRSNNLGIVNLLFAPGWKPPSH